MVVPYDISKELPDIDTISLTDTNDLIIIVRVEYYSSERVCVSNKALKVIGCRLLCLVVPNLDHVIKASREHVA